MGMAGHFYSAEGGEMMRRIFCTVAAALLLSGCLLESVGQLDNSVRPYGAHWFKEGMTREARRADLAACGALNGEEKIRFHPEQISAAKKPSDPNEIAAYVRLRDQVGLCMQGKGYIPIGDIKFLNDCDERCMYP